MCGEQVACSHKGVRGFSVVVLLLVQLPDAVHIRRQVILFQVSGSFLHKWELQSVTWPRSLLQSSLSVLQVSKQVNQKSGIS